MEITRKELNRIKGLKFLDIQQCSFCHQITILNLDWKPFKKLYCLVDEEEHTLCPKLCLKVAKNILGCELYKKLEENQKQEARTNLKHYKSQCYFCSKELKGAGKTSLIKNRNNSTFWGLVEKFISCLSCLKRKFYLKLEKEKRKTLNKYLKRGHV